MSQFLLRSLKKINAIQMSLKVFDFALMKRRGYLSGGRTNSI